MTDKEIIRTSKFLSLILRHEPERVGLTLDSAGWVSVDTLLQAIKREGYQMSLEQLRHIVDFCLLLLDKQILARGPCSPAIYSYGKHLSHS